MRREKKPSHLTTLAPLLTPLLLAGCIYRVDVPQGNYLEQDRVNLLRVNMTREQVRYVLGTPVTIDPFNKNRWNYVFLIQEGWDDPVQKNLFAVFEGDRLVDIQGDFSKGPDFSQPLQ
ncbi:MAG: outer membrane protein assembly factor BamE [Succinivibrionaceae bacterium]|nr:outer membrane protein assembly factor BamE [Succinivibrionaceae bacterium]